MICSLRTHLKIYVRTSWDDILHSAVQYFVTDCVGGMGGFLPSETSRLVLSYLLAEGLTDTR